MILVHEEVAQILSNAMVLSSGLTSVKSSELTSREPPNGSHIEAFDHNLVDDAEGEQGKDDGDSKDEKNAEEDLEIYYDQIYVGRLAPTPSGYMHGNSTLSLL